MLLCPAPLGSCSTQGFLCHPGNALAVKPSDPGMAPSPPVPKQHRCQLRALAP